MRGIRELFCFLPDEKIYFGIMEIEEKRRLLEGIRNDDNMTYIRRKFFLAKMRCKRYNHAMLMRGGCQWAFQ